MKHPPKDKEFLSQIPDWESAYKESDEPMINYSKSEFVSAEPHLSPHALTILGEPVMEDWEAPYMDVLAEIATSRGGIVLELGYGMGISAQIIQSYKIKRHIIIEANHGVAHMARTWASTARIETIVLEGLWQDVISEISTESLDGILFDTYPLSEVELYQNHFSFFPHAFEKLKSGGVFTYYSDEVADFSSVHIRKLLAAGFLRCNISGKIVPVSPPSSCEYWKAQTILAPVVYK